MSKLFNTLRDVLTPYANKINLHSEEIEEIQGDVSEVKADLDDNVNDLKSAINGIENLNDKISLSGLNWESGKYIDSSGKYKSSNNYSASADFVDISNGEYEFVVESGAAGYIAYYSGTDENNDYLSKASVNNETASGFERKINVNSTAKYARFQINGTDLSKNNSVYLIRKEDVYKLNEQIDKKADKATTYVEQTGIASQYTMKKDGSAYTIGYKKTYTVSGKPKIKISGYRYGNPPLFVCMLNNSIVGFDLDASSGLNTDYEIQIPFTVDTIIVNGQTENQISLAVLEEYDYIKKYQGMQNAGKYLKVNSSGNAVPVIIPEEKNFNGFNLEKFFSELADVYYDDFYERDHFIDEAHPYIRIGGQNSAEPTMVTGTGCSAINLTERYTMARNFDRFPLVFAVGNMGTAYKQLAFYATGANSSQMETVAISSNGAVYYGGGTIGVLSSLSGYFMFVVEKDKATIFDDTGFSVEVPMKYIDGLPMNYGLYFGNNADRTYGYASWIEYKIQKLTNIDIGKLLANQASLVSTVRQYKDGDTAPMVNWPGSPYIYVLTDSDNDPRYKHTNAPVLKCHDDWEDHSYRTEFRTTVNIKNLERFGSLQRHKFSADYYLPSADNLPSTYTTTIFQVHDSDFYTDGWTDPPPVKIDFDANGKLTAQITSIPDGTIPTGASSSENRIVRTTYELCDAPMDEWFNIEVDCRVAWLSGLMPYVRIIVNGNEKLNVSIPVGYNIISSNGYTHIQTGLYTPSWKTGTYNNMSRTIYLANIKYAY